MTYLELVNLARRECGIAGGDLRSLSGLSAESNRFARWVADEWVLLQTEQSTWNFLRRDFAFETVADQRMYTPQQAKATDDGTDTGSAILADWKIDSLRLSTAGQNYADEAILGFVTWSQYRDMYMFGSTRTQRSKPVVFSIRPDDEALAFGDAPDGVYVVEGEFYRTPQELVAADDVPIMPARFHPLIAYRAIAAYGAFSAAPEVLGRAEMVISRLHLDLIADQLPQIMTGPPLVA